MKGITAETLSAIGLDPERRHTWTRIQNLYRRAWEKLRVGEKSGRNNHGGGRADAQKQQRIERENAMIPDVLESIQKYPTLKIEVRARMMGVSGHNVRSVMFRLEQEGVIRREGESSKTSWHVTDMVGAE